MFEEIEFTNNPRHGIVRQIRNLKDSSITNFLRVFSDEISELRENDKKFDTEDALMYLMAEHPDEFLEFTKDEENNELIIAISLATNRMWKIEELDEYSFDEVEMLYDKSLEILGGDVNRFFKKSRLNIPQEEPKKIQKSANKKKS